MGLFDQIRKGREGARSKREYADCSKVRKDKLRSFREKMILEMLFKYPDANLLMTSVSRDFQVLLKDRGGLLLGEFADEHWPRLDYVADTASTVERLEAVAGFRRARISEGCPAKGFEITGSIGLDSLVGASLFLNGKQVAKASVRHPRPKGYFTARLFDEVLQGGNRGAGIQSLLFVTAAYDILAAQMKMSHEILFDRSLQYFDENNRKEFTGAILNLRDFIADLEDYFRPDCPMAEKTRDDMWLRGSAEIEDWLLDTPDRDKCEANEYSYQYTFRFDNW